MAKVFFFNLVFIINIVLFIIVKNKICSEAELCFDNEGNYWSLQKELS